MPLAMIQAFCKYTDAETIVLNSIYGSHSMFIINETDTLNAIARLNCSGQKASLDGNRFDDYYCVYLPVEIHRLLSR